MNLRYTARTVRGPALAWAMVVCLGLLHLPYPFSGDQALFALYAQGLAQGASLYVDLWDNKQPGIFAFYAAARALFGSGPEAVHALELVWLLGAAVVLERVLRWALVTSLWRACAPLFSAGLLYWCARRSSMAQVETLVALPLCLCMWAAMRIGLGQANAEQPQADSVQWPSARLQPRGHWRWQTLFGLGAAGLTLFKIALAPVPLALWLVAMVSQWRGLRAAKPVISLQTFAWRACGSGAVAIAFALVPWLLVLGWFAVQGHLQPFWWTQFGYPSLALRELGSKPVVNFFANAAWLALTLAPAVPLFWLWRRGLAGSLSGLEQTSGALRHGASWSAVRAAPAQLLAYLCWAWLLAGLVAIVVQRWSWWGYHFNLLLVPVGVLMLLAADALWLRNPAGSTARKVAMLCLWGVPVLGATPMVKTAQAWWAAAQAPAGQTLAAYRAVLDPQHAVHMAQAAFLRQDRGSGPSGDTAYVFGDPHLLLLANRRQALPVHGWSWEVMLQSQWAQLAEQLERHRPGHVYVAQEYSNMLPQRAPAAWQWLLQQYEPVPESISASPAALGVWYRLRPAKP